jgi:signal transduction histidine kinase
MEPKRHTLLIVDDEPDVLDSLRHLFRRQYRVLMASGGEEALKLLAENSVQIILSDQRMPGMSGDALLSRAREEYPDAIRLLFTGYADIQAVIHAVNEGGIFRYILKPWDPNELEATVRQAYEQYELLAERRRLVEELRGANDQLTEANRELEESNQLKTAFLEVASHELNTPITIVQGLSELLPLLNPSRDPKEREILAQLSQAARQLATLVSTMLKLMRANDFRQSLRLGLTPLGPLLREVCNRVRPFFEARHQELRIEVADDLGDFELDADKIRDVLLNLLTNAIKFTPDGGQIHVGARLIAPDEAEIQVADRGIGLEPRALSHLFQPFFTEFDPSRHSSGNFEFGKRGLGLGLSLVKKFIELHGGRISVDSVLGEGTRFTVLMPRRVGRDGDLGVQSASPDDALSPEQVPGPE